MQVGGVGSTLGARQRHLGVRISWQVLKKGCASCVPEAHSDSRMKDGSEWLQGGEAEEESVQAEVVGLEPGLGQWDGEEGGWEKRDSLRIDRGREDYEATRQRS